MFKKITLALTLVSTGMSMASASIVPQEKLVVTGYEMGMAYDGKGNTTPVFIEKIGTDARFTVFNNDLVQTEQFTAKNVFEEVQDGDKIIYIKELKCLEHPFDLRGSDIYISRGIFSHDGSWNILIKDSSGQTDTYEVYKVSGEKICDLPLSKEEYLGYTFTWCGEFYTADFGSPWQYRTFLETEDYAQFTFWKFEDNSGVVTPVAATTRLEAYPNPLPAGATLKISFPREADSHTIVTVSDMNGRQVFKRQVPAGESTLAVSPRFAHGLHVYTVIYSDGETASGKLAAE